MKTDVLGKEIDTTKNWLEILELKTVIFEKQITGRMETENSMNLKVHQ